MQNYSPDDRPDWAPYAKYIHTLTVNEGITRIGEYAFTELRWLYAASLGEDLEEIKTAAFQGCVSLVSVYLGRNMETIEDDAFRSCYKLAEVASDCSLDIKKGSADNGMIGYYAINVHGDEPEYVELDEFLFVEGKDAYHFMGYIGEESSITLPDSVDGEEFVIGAYAFLGNSTVTEVDLGGATEILSNAFTGDVMITGVTAGSATETVAENAFAHNKALVTVRLTGATRIGDFAFLNCEKLTNVTLSAVTTVSKSAFRNCTALVSASLPKATKVETAAFYNCISLNEVTLSDSLSSIGEYAFYGAGLRTFVFPDKTAEVGAKAFMGCSRLSSVTLGTGMKKIGKDAFEDCLCLIEVVNKSSLDVVAGSTAHGYLAAYAKVVSKTSSKIVNENDFLGITVSQPGVDGGMPTTTTYLLGYVGNHYNLTLPSAFSGNSYYIYDGAFYGMDIGTLTFPKTGVNGIGYQAFAYTKINAKVVIPGSITKIGMAAFMGSTVKYVEFGKGVTVIGQAAFKDCRSLCLAVQPAGDSITTIEQDAFYNSGLVSYIMPSTLSSVGNRAFKYCYNLYEVIKNAKLNPAIGKRDVGYLGFYAKKVESAGAKSKTVVEDGFVYYDGVVCYLVGYVGEESVLMIPTKGPEGSFDIAPYAFYGRRDITCVVVQGKSAIGAFAFAECENLIGVYLAKNVSTIENFAFDGCSTALAIVSEAGSANRKWEDAWNSAESGYLIGEDKVTAPNNSKVPGLVLTMYKAYNVAYDVDLEDFLSAMGLIQDESDEGIEEEE